MDEIAFLEEMVRIPSPTGEEGAIGEYMVAQMKALGLAASRDEVGNAIGVAGDPQAGRTVLLLGHMDTVPPELAVYRRGNLLYGRGTVDAKGALAAFVLATARVAERLEGIRIVVVGAVEEEDPRGKGAHHLIETMEQPECAIIGEPNTWEGIALGYKGLLSVDYCWTQPGGHSAGRLAGPAEKAITFWSRLVDHAEQVNHGRQGLFATLDPALREFNTASKEAHENVRMNIVLRLPPAFDVTDLKRRMHEWGDGAALVFPGYEPAYRANKNALPARVLLRAIRAEGGRPRFKLKTGTSDMNVVGAVWNCPMVAYGPGDSSLDHTPEEHVDVREYRRAIRVLKRALVDLCLR
jgi:LysW-gamma-L-lysine carboxypeptidase